MTIGARVIVTDEMDFGTPRCPSDANWLILWYYAVANPMADLNIVPIANLRRDLANVASNSRELSSAFFVQCYRKRHQGGTYIAWPRPNLCSLVVIL